jgi:hypothetical protein
VESGVSLRRLIAGLTIEAILAGVVLPLAMALETYSAVAAPFCVSTLSAR